MALIGVAIVSYAGHQKEIQLGSEVKEFNVKLGLLLAILCGIFSSGMSLCDRCGQPDGGRCEAARRQFALRGSSQLRHHHGRRRGGQSELLLHPAGGAEAAFAAQPILASRGPS